MATFWHRAAAMAMTVLLAGCDDNGGFSEPAYCASFKGGQYETETVSFPDDCGTRSVGPEPADGDLRTASFVQSPSGCFQNLYARAYAPDPTTVYPAGSRVGAYIKRSANVDLEELIVQIYLKGANGSAKLGDELDVIPAGSGTGADEYVFFVADEPFDSVSFFFDSVENGRGSIYELCINGR